MEVEMNACRLINGIVLAFWTGFSGMAAIPDVWNIRSSPSSNQLNGVAYGNGLFVAVGSQATILTSLNGRDWIARSAETIGVPPGDGHAATIWSAAYGNGRYVVGGDLEALIRSSTDGAYWPRTNGVLTIGIESIY